MYLMGRYDFSRMQFVGASAGALVATIAACEVDPETAVKVAYRLVRSQPQGEGSEIVFKNSSSACERTLWRP